MIRRDRARFERTFLTLARAVTVGAAYVAASPIPGLTSSFVAIFTALLPFDIFVALASPPLRLKDWEQFFAVLKPRIISTASTLAKGVAVGTFFGIVAILGLPYPLGAVFTSGIAYVWALETKHAISTYVSIISGLALFDRLARLEAVETTSIMLEIVYAITLFGGGTFTALAAGWGVGLIGGSVTRLFLSRPYRSIRSAAYELPLQMRPFNEVVQIGEKNLVASVTVEESAKVAHRSLAESGLREQWGTTILSIKRGAQEVVMPKGSTVLLPGDQALLITESEKLAEVSALFKADRAASDAKALSPG